MNIYKISQNKNENYDSYDSAIVAANNEDEAKTIHPGMDVNYPSYNPWESSVYSWVTSSDDVKVEKIGEGYKGPKGVILASFNAG